MISKEIEKLSQLEEILKKYIITNLEELEKILDENLKQFTQMGYGDRTWEDYHKIEEEIGIDLITLFKALTNGIYVNDGVSIVFYPSRELRLGYDTHYGKVDELCILKDCNYAGNTKLVSLTNYGKTWALTKEELEKNEPNNI